MSKKSNTILFLIGATIFNIITTIICFLVLLVLYGRLLVPVLPKEIAAWGMPIIFVGAIVLAFLVYRFAVNVLMKKVDVEKIFDPLFMPRRARRKD
jgi:hypothetical protein